MILCVIKTAHVIIMMLVQVGLAVGTTEDDTKKAELTSIRLQVSVLLCILLNNLSSKTLQEGVCPSVGVVGYSGYFAALMSKKESTKPIT